MNGKYPSPQQHHGRTARANSRYPKLGLLILLCSLIVAWSCGRGATRQSEGPLAVLLAEVRPGPGRLVDAPWLKPTPPGTQLPTNVVKAATRASSHRLEEESTEHTLRDLAVITLLAGQTDLAIAQLSRATELAPANATLWSDLAAAHLQRGVVASDPYEIFLALSAANHAVHCDPTLITARFNRALALEQLSLRERAKAEWRLVMDLEHDPAWAREAQGHATALDQPTSIPDWKRTASTVETWAAQGKTGLVRSAVAGSQQRFREYLEGKLLAEWAVAKIKRREIEAARKLATARAIADALVATGGDRMAADTIYKIEQLRATNPAGLRQLVAGFIAYSEGLKLAEKDRSARALASFQTARRLLAGQRSPFAQWAAYQIARCHYQLANYRQAWVQAQKLTQVQANKTYNALRGRSFSLTGLIDGNEGRPAAAIIAYEKAAASFREAQETPLVARANGIIATALFTLGQYKEAWRRLYPALIEPSTFGMSEIRGGLYIDAAAMAQEQGETEIALWFQDEVLRNLQGGDINMLCMRASLLAMLGRQTEALKDLAKARSLLEKIPDPKLRRSLEGDLLWAEAELAVTNSPRQAIAKLNEAIPIFRATSYRYRLGHALYLRAQAERALAQNDTAEQDLAAAIAESERQREMITAAGDRISYLDRQKELFDTMITFQLEQRKRPDTALRFSEQAKARVLWDWILTRPAQRAVPASLQQATAPLDLPSVQRSLPEGTLLVEYAVLPRKTVLWILRHQGEPQWQTAEIGAEALGDLVQRFRRALVDHRSAEVTEISQRLYNVLIRPVAGKMAPGEKLVLIPDGPLHVLPFPLLRNRQSGRYLIQDHACLLAPSARVLAASIQRDATLARRPERRALVVAAPDFDLTIDPTLLPLRSGETDASIARIFSGSQVLQGQAATREAFLRASGGFEILHFGGHSVINADFPLLSRMLFAKNTADPNRGVLYSGDILEQRFPHTRLAVLASCSTAAGRISRTEGVESLARPFLAAGVPTVIAALWDVDDQATADFFVRFYHHLAQRFDIAGALQATQIDALKQGTDPKAWGAFEVIGSGATEPDPIH